MFGVFVWGAVYIKFRPWDAAALRRRPSCSQVYPGGTSGLRRKGTQPHGTWEEGQRPSQKSRSPGILTCKQNPQCTSKLAMGRLLRTDMEHGPLNTNKARICLRERNIVYSAGFSSFSRQSAAFAADLLYQRHQLCAFQVPMHLCQQRQSSMHGLISPGALLPRRRQRERETESEIEIDTRALAKCNESLMMLSTDPSNIWRQVRSDRLAKPEGQSWNLQLQSPTRAPPRGQHAPWRIPLQARPGLPTSSLEALIRRTYNQWWFW